MSWSIQGPPGVTGPQGATGQPGATGAQGPGATALHFSDSATSSSPPLTAFATAGPFTFAEQCELTGGGVEAILTATSNDRWGGYGSISNQDITSGSPATTDIGSLGLSAGERADLAEVPTSASDQSVTTADYQVEDQSTGHMYEIAVSVSAIGGNRTCNAFGAVMPAS